MIQATSQQEVVVMTIISGFNSFAFLRTEIPFIWPMVISGSAKYVPQEKLMV